MASNGIKKTKNYKQFKFYKANRIVRTPFLSVLKKSILKKNLLYLNPIIVNEKMEVIDGQHRLIAAQELGVPIYYMIAPDLGFEDILLLNANVVKWSTIEYLDAYIKLGLEDYKKLKQFSRKYNISITNSLATLSLKDKGSNQFIAHLAEFREGNFKVENYSLAVKFIEFAKQTEPFLLENVIRDRDFLSACWWVYKNDSIDKEAFIASLEAFPRRVHRCGAIREYLRQFEDIFNYQRRSHSGKSQGLKQQTRFF